MVSSRGLWSGFQVCEQAPRPAAQGPDTDIQNPASGFVLHVLGAARGAREILVRERTREGRLRYQQDYNAGKVGKTLYSRSGKDLPVGRAKRIFNREGVIELRQKGACVRVIAKQLELRVRTVARTVRRRNRVETPRTCCMSY